MKSEVGSSSFGETEIVQREEEKEEILKSRDGNVSTSTVTREGEGEKEETSEVGSSSFGETETGQQEEEKEEISKSRYGNVSTSTVTGEGEGEKKETWKYRDCNASTSGEVDVSEELTEPSESIEDADAIVSRLEELLLGNEVPELTEEQLKNNDQLQEDELLALESIYGDNVLILERHSGLRFFQIHIDIEAPSELNVSASLNFSGDHRTKSDKTDEFLYSFKVQYLPPIVLTCLLPQCYPSHLPPCFTIFVQWLDSIRISNLCTMLDSMWMQQPGQEIIYQWIEWLHGSSLSYLGFDEEIVLGPYGMPHPGDRRALSGSISPDVLIPSMKRYNDEQCCENFFQNLHECCICFCEYAGTEFIRLPCQHFFCRNCMKSYSDIHVKEGTIMKLQCPDVKCGGMIPPGLLKLLLRDEDFERWESLMLQKTLDSMSDVGYCPRCEMVCIEDEDHHALCPNCLYSFCTLCKGQRHVGVCCRTVKEKLDLFKSIENSGQLTCKEERAINEILSVEEIRDYKQCPSCKMGITHAGGCNKMVCGNCGQYFCYSCGKGIKGYDHFGNGECTIYPEETIRLWEEQMNPHPQVLHRPRRLLRVREELINPRRVLTQAQAQAQVNDAHKCPTCNHTNAKVDDNNLILCGACQNHYCYLCKKPVKRAALHYGPKGCKQYRTR